MRVCPEIGYPKNLGTCWQSIIPHFQTNPGCHTEGPTGQCKQHFPQNRAKKNFVHIFPYISPYLHMFPYVSICFHILWVEVCQVSVYRGCHLAQGRPIRGGSGLAEGPLNICRGKIGGGTATTLTGYPLVTKHSYGKLPFIDIYSEYTH